MYFAALQKMVTISAASTPSDFTPASKNDRRSTQFRIKGSFSSKESMISKKGLRSLVALRAPWGPIWAKDFKREGAYLAPAVERTPQSPRIDRGGRAIAAADNGSTASWGRHTFYIQLADIHAWKRINKNILKFHAWSPICSRRPIQTFAKWISYDGYIHVHTNLKENKRYPQEVFSILALHFDLHTSQDPEE